MCKTWSSLHSECEQELGPRLELLLKTWDEIGFTAESRSNRQRVFVSHLCNIADEMIAEEESKKQKLMDNVFKYKLIVHNLLSELRLAVAELEAEVDDELATMTLIKKDSFLRSRVDELNAEKQRRLGILAELHQVENVICNNLGKSALSSNMVAGTVPTEEELQQIRNYVHGLRAKQERRKSIFEATKKSIIQLMSEIGVEPSSDFENDVVCEDAETFCLSSDRLRALANLLDDLEQRKQKMVKQAEQLQEQIKHAWDRLRIPDPERPSFDLASGVTQQALSALSAELERCHQLLVENIKTLVGSAAVEIQQLCDKCYLSDQQRAVFTVDVKEEATEETLHRVDENLCRLQKWYSDNKVLFTKVDQWNTLWQQFLHLERMATDPSRLSNRGGVLLKDDALRKRLLRDMPLLEKEIIEAMAFHNAEDKELSVHINNRPFEEYVRDEMIAYMQRKEIEKTRRHEQKTKTTQFEMHFGSQPVSAARKRTAPNATNEQTSTPSRLVVPSKRLRQHNETKATPQGPRILTSTVNHSQLASRAVSRRRSSRLNASKVNQVSVPKSPFTANMTRYSVISSPFTTLQSTPSTPLSARPNPSTRSQAKAARPSDYNSAKAPAHSPFKWTLSQAKPVFRLLL